MAQLVGQRDLILRTGLARSGSTLQRMRSRYDGWMPRQTKTYSGLIARRAA